MPMLNMLFVLAAVGLTGILGSVWSQVIRRLVAGQSLVAWEPRRAARWGFLDVALAIFLMLLFALLAATMVNAGLGIAPGTQIAEAPLAYQRWMIFAQGWASLATTIASALWILTRCHISWRDLGFDRRAVWRDLRLGSAAFFVLAPPIYGLQIVLVQWFESKHPIVELVRAHSDPGLIAASLFSAVVVAPIFEEYLFRGVVQGWLERWFWIGGNPRSWFWGETCRGPSESSTPPFAQPDSALWQPVADTRSLRANLPGDDDSPEPLSHSDGEFFQAAGTELGEDPSGAAGPRRLGADGPPPGVRGFLPIVASSSLFAALHVSHGPDWIPLFFLAVGLGYLYRQTNRLLPSMVVHFLLNGTSMGMFLVEILRA